MIFGWYIFRKSGWLRFGIERDRWIPRFDQNGEIYMWYRERP